MIKYDLHTHTYLSSCAKRDAFLKDYVAKAKEIGLEMLGITDHCWETTVEGASQWYSDQGYERLQKTRDDLARIDTMGINVLVGAEGEYAQELLAVNSNSIKYLDYLIVPHSHTHMRGFVLPRDCVGIPEKHAEYLVRSFISLCNHEMREYIFGIAHPMYPIGDNAEYAAQVYSFITDEMLDKCASAARENDMAIEANLSVISQIPDNTPYRRFFAACKKAGCKFYIGSDAHTPNRLELHQSQGELIQRIGMTEDDFKIEEPRKLNG